MISFVLPVYNCNRELIEGLPGFIRLMKKASDEIEVIIVDDCSVERMDIIRLAKCFNCKYLGNERNMGKGYSVKRGVLHSSGDIIICMDGDFPFELDAVFLMTEVLTSTESDMVIGDRTLPDSSFPNNLSFFRKAGSSVLSLITGTFFIRGFYDTQCGLKGFRRQVAKSIFSRITQNGFSFDLELLFMAKKRRLHISRIPVKVRSQNASSVDIVKDGLKSFKALFEIYFNQLSGKYKV